jgi:acetoin:2,6-dichlorophenolindophenol oxidoreductase subunit alpha
MVYGRCRSSLSERKETGSTSFLRVAGLTGVGVSLGSRVALANGEIGFWAQDLSDEKLVDMFSTILRIRWHERTMADKMLSDPDYRGYNHFYAGQEAVATGVCAALRNDGPFDQIDLVYSTHRPTGHAIAKGRGHEAMCAENDFRATGLNNGYGAEMHLADPSVGFIGADGMIGPGPVLAQGSAFAFRARGSDQVSVVFGGDGTYATPHFHSTLNNAKLLDLPFIYILENNLYHQYAHYSYSSPHTDIAEAARAYGIPARVVDGQDVFQVYNAMHEAVERGAPAAVRASSKPRPTATTTTGVPPAPRSASSGPSATIRWRSRPSAPNASCAPGCSATRWISAARR